MKRTESPVLLSQSSHGLLGMHQPVLASERVTLRPSAGEDVDFLLSVASEPLISLICEVPSDPEVDGVQVFIASQRARLEAGHGWAWAITSPDRHALAYVGAPVDRSTSGAGLAFAVCRFEDTRHAVAGQRNGSPLTRAVTCRVADGITDVSVGLIWRAPGVLIRVAASVCGRCDPEPQGAEPTRLRSSRGMLIRHVAIDCARSGKGAAIPPLSAGAATVVLGHWEDMMGQSPSQAHARPTKMADLAKMAGVSVTTVSHVLNQSRFVSDEARDRVLDAVRQTGYTTNILARSMKTASTSTIGLAAPALSKAALADLVRPIEAMARAQGLSILLTDTEDDPLVELAAVTALHARRVDGIIIAPAGSDTPAVHYLRRHNIATVVVDRLTTGGFDQIGTENTKAAKQLTEHLIVNAGYRRIALITGMPNLSTSRERQTGYLRALREHGIEVDPSLMDSAYDDSSRLAAALDRLLSMADPPTALFAGNSSTTIGVMRAAGSWGVRVPEDLALVGFDDFEWADVFHPRLTVIRQRVQEIGTKAVQLLQRRIADPNMPVRTRRVAADFIHRDSCGCHLTTP